MEKSSVWYKDERHREQLAVVVRDDLLGLGRYIVNRKKVIKAREEVRARQQRKTSHKTVSRNDDFNNGHL